MDNESTIVVDDNRLLSELLGANDTNIRLLEELTRSSIRPRGNELRVLSSDPRDGQTVVRAIAELNRYAQEGRAPEPGLVRAVVAEVSKTGSADHLRDAGIRIPGSDRVVFPRSRHQASYVNALRRSPLTMALGPAGTGKTFLAVAVALEFVLSRKRKRLVLTRPVVEAGESLGFLPGDLIQKVSPYLRPLYDAMGALVPHEIIQRLKESETLEVAPLAYMRGRSIENAVIILDEAQNTTREQMKMFLTRLGEETTAVVCGDDTQVDLPFGAVSGLTDAARVLRGVDGVETVRFTTGDIVRSPLAMKIVEAYRRSDSHRETSHRKTDHRKTGHS